MTLWKETVSKSICWVLIIIVGLVLATIPVFLNNVEGEDKSQYSDEEVKKGDYRKFSVDLHGHKELTFSIEVTLGTEVDVYLLSSAEYSNYRNGKQFQAVKEYEICTSAQGSFKDKKSDNYYIIVDNLDNVRSSDAQPKADVEFSLSYEIEEGHWYDSFSGIYGMLWIVGLLLVISIWIVYFHCDEEKGFPCPPMIRFMNLFTVKQREKPAPPLYGKRRRKRIKDRSPPTQNNHGNEDRTDDVDDNIDEY